MFSAGLSLNKRRPWSRILSPLKKKENQTKALSLMSFKAQRTQYFKERPPATLTIFLSKSSVSRHSESNVENLYWSPLLRKNRRQIEFIFDELDESKGGELIYIGIRGWCFWYIPPIIHWICYFSSHVHSSKISAWSQSKKSWVKKIGMEYYLESYSWSDPER